MDGKKELNDIPPFWEIAWFLLDDFYSYKFLYMIIPLLVEFSPNIASNEVAIPNRDNDFRSASFSTRCSYLNFLPSAKIVVFLQGLLLFVADIATYLQRFLKEIVVSLRISLLSIRYR